MSLWPFSRGILKKNSCPPYIDENAHVKRLCSEHKTQSRKRKDHSHWFPASIQNRYGNEDSHNECRKAYFISLADMNKA